MPGSSTPGPLACVQATRPASLHSSLPGSWRRTFTRDPTRAQCCEFTNTPPTDRLVPHPLKVPSSDETPTMTSWCTRALRRVGVLGLDPSLIAGKITPSESAGAASGLDRPQLGRDPQLGLGHVLDVLGSDARGHLAQHEALRRDVDDRQLADHHVDALLAGERQAALLQQLL